ncbi:MAG: rhamnulokinase [Acidobacteriaceae bacterium]|nr:rhamnulokinase [Acidobacteriaceae bacterium]MBV9780726.1 rhamnulokinase [Acidobacteriaceae bacterium]
MSRNYLALDLGAESGRAVLARIDRGRIELNEVHRFANTPVQLPDGLYWDALRLFHEICEGIRAAGNLHGIGIDTWGVDFGLIAEDGGLLGNPRHYRDRRTRGVPEEVFRIISRDEIFRRTGVQFMEINSLYQLCALRRDSPQLVGLASRLLFMPDLFNYFLTGKLASEATIASTSQFYDPVNRCFSAEILHGLDVDARILPELRETGTELGPVLPKITEGCGLKQGIKVNTTASHDTASAVAAVPARMTEEWCYISSGTWSLMGVEADKPIINEASLRANFTNEAGIGGTIRFLKNIPGMWLIQECKRAWAREGRDYSYADLMERAAAASTTETRIDVEQFTTPGNLPERICDYCRKTEQEVPADTGAMCRAILESLAARYRDVLDALESITRRKIEVIHIVGGGSRNKLLNQLTADATGRHVVAGPTEATAAGNALVQALGAGEIGSLKDMREIARRSFHLDEFVPKT